MVIGKVIGVLAGLMVNWFPEGAIIGLIVGILLDELVLKRVVQRSKETYWMQEFSCLYLELLASVAVAKGKITKQDIICIRNDAYIAAKDNPIANRILKRAKKNRKNYNYLIEEIQSCCEGVENMLSIVANGAARVGVLQGAAGRQKVEQLFHEFGMPPVNWGKVSIDDGISQASSRKKASGSSSSSKQGQDHSYDDSPHVTRAYGSKSPYAVLGVKSTATAADIKKAYRSLIQKHHPDRVRAEGKSDKAVEKAEKKVAEINAAYEVLQKKKRP
ncbi:MAG: DnaJ domain-containing protein [Pseudomonadota bacterium]|nr:DnaJ domain-containing protein [Pseudomonadota bacterium]